MFGRYATTRSPRPTPSRCRPARARATCSRSSPNVSSRRPARLRARDDRHRARVLVATDHVLGVVQPRAREPLRARHLARPEHALVRRVRADLEVLPDRRPEALEVGDRPAPQGVVVVEVEAALAAQPVQVAPDLRALAHVRRRRPDDLPLGRRPAGERVHHGTSTARPVISPSRSRSSTSFTSSSG